MIGYPIQTKACDWLSYWIGPHHASHRFICSCSLAHFHLLFCSPLSLLLITHPSFTLCIYLITTFFSLLCSLSFLLFAILIFLIFFSSPLHPLLCTPFRSSFTHVLHFLPMLLSFVCSAISAQPCASLIKRRDEYVGPFIRDMFYQQHRPQQG